MTDFNKTRDELYEKLNKLGLCYLNIANLLKQKNLAAPGKGELEYITLLSFRLEDEFYCGAKAMEFCEDLAEKMKPVANADIDPDHIPTISELNTLRLHKTGQDGS